MPIEGRAVVVWEAGAPAAPEPILTPGRIPGNGARRSTQERRRVLNTCALLVRSMRASYNRPLPQQNTPEALGLGGVMWMELTDFSELRQAAGPGRWFVPPG